MHGYRTLLRKELLEAWRTYRAPIALALFALVGLTSPLLARYTPEILEAALGDQLPAIPIPPPTIADSVAQVHRNLIQFGALAAILLAMGAVATETERGTAAFVLARPVSRVAFLAAKVIALGLVLAVATALAIGLGWFYTAILFEPPSIGGWLAMGVLTWLALAAYGAITLLASTVTGSAVAAGGVGFVAFLTVSLAAIVPAIARLSPAGLSEPAIGLASGTATVASLGTDLWLPVVATAILVGACLTLTAIAFRRREL